MTDASLAPTPDAPPIAGDAARPLKLLALDADDLVVVSAFVQDAIAKPVEMRRLPGEHAFVMVVDRLAREEGPEREGFLRRRKVWQRRRSVLDFRTVRSVKRRGFAGGDDEPMVLLAITHVPATAPDNAAEATGNDETITLHFAGDAEVRLAVEAVEARLTDLGPAWKSDRTPRHP